MSVGVTILAALLTACWHALSRNEKPDPSELAVGLDLLVAAMVLLSGFIPGSHGQRLVFRWVGVALLSVMLTAIAVALKIFGYEKSEHLYRLTMVGARRTYLPADRMKRWAAWITSIVGCLMLAAIWWLNVDIGIVVSWWKEHMH